MVRQNRTGRNALAVISACLAMIMTAILMPCAVVRAATVPTVMAGRALAPGHTWASSSPHLWYRVTVGKTTVTVKFFVTTDKPMKLLTAAPDRDLQGTVSGPALSSSTGGIMVSIDLPSGILSLKVGDTQVGTVVAKRPSSSAVWKVTMHVSMRDTASGRMVVRSFMDTVQIPSQH